MARSEQEVFSDLRRVCTTSGFAHALAFLCFRDNAILYGDEVTAEAVQEQFSYSNLCRTEINTLIGLLTSAPIDFTLPVPETTENMIQAAETLLEELHTCLGAPLFSSLTLERPDEPGFNPWDSGSAMREPIFYGGEAAYNFQYLHFLEDKYGKDDAWLITNKGFSSSQMRRLAEILVIVQNRNLLNHFRSLGNTDTSAWTLLDGFSFTTADIMAETDLPDGVVEAILNAFTMNATSHNPTFSGLSEFNQVSATPIIQFGERYILFQNYTLLEAAYESPFFWMFQDKGYAAKASAHRGNFTEKFGHQCLSKVFGPARVWSNIHISGPKGKDFGEIDVLVVYGNMAIVAQAKSKRLTIASRKGNDKSIRKDIAGAVQDAYDQGLDCSIAILEGGCRLILPDGSPLTLPHKVERVYPICILADHYPALTFQSRQFLKPRKVDGVAPALIARCDYRDAFFSAIPIRLYRPSGAQLRALYGSTRAYPAVSVFRALFRYRSQLRSCHASRRHRIAPRRRYASQENGGCW